MRTPTLALEGSPGGLVSEVELMTAGAWREEVGNLTATEVPGVRTLRAQLMW